MVYSYLLPFCYLEHKESLRLGHAKRLMIWVRFYTISLLHGKQFEATGNITPLVIRSSCYVIFKKAETLHFKLVLTVHLPVLQFCS